MLQNLQVHPTIPVNDLDRAKKFYEEKMGLKGEESPGGIMYKCGGGTHFLLFKSAGAGQSSGTCAGWMTDDIEAEVKELRGRGLEFEDIDIPGIKTEKGIAAMGDNRAAWFKDSEGNRLGLVQLANPV